MEIKRYDGTGRMSKAVIHGNTLYLAGQTAAGGDVATQTKAVLDKIEATLTRHGSNRRQILSATIFLKDMANFAAMNEIWDAWIENGHEPARACVQARMATEEIEVEICVIAAV